MVLKRILELSNTPLNIRIKIISISIFYNSLLRNIFKGYIDISNGYPKGLKTIIENNYILNSAISETPKDLKLKSISLLKRNKLVKYIEEYNIYEPLLRNNLVNNLKELKLPFELSILVIPYFKYVIVKELVKLLIKDVWDKESNRYVKILIKNLKFLSSGETRTVWLDICYLNNYLSKIDRSGFYNNLSIESKSFIQSSLHKKYRLNTNIFITDFLNFPPTVTAAQRINSLIDELYKRYMTPYLILTFFLTTIIIAIQYLLFENITFVILSIPLSIISAYELTNYIIHTLIPPRKTLSLGKDILLPKVYVAGCIPFIITSTKDIKRIGDEIVRLKISNPSYKYVKYFVLVDLIDTFSKDENEIIEIHKELDFLFNNLNSKYIDKTFYYFLRDRVFSEKQNRYMGWERKRGKIEEFINYLYKEKTKSKIYTNYDSDITFKYILTIDEGSHVSKDIVTELLHRAENTYNKPILESNTVKQGYGIFQPKVSSKQDFNRTVFQKIFNKFEKYHTYSSTEDVTFSIFGEYYYQGKGLINIEMYRKLCIEKFPEDVLLSHDLIEGSYLRVAHVDDCTIFESYPIGFDSYLQRLNRWIRGDINTILWLLPYLKKFSIEFPNYSLNRIGKIRILINLLNILKFPIILISPLLLSIPLVGFIFNWSITQLSWIIDLFKKVIQFIIKKHSLEFKLKSFVRSIDYWRVFELISIPLLAVNSLHAISVSFIRLFITKKYTLTWVSSRTTEKLKNFISLSLLLKTISLVFLISLVDIQYATLMLGITVLVTVITLILSKEIRSKSSLSSKDSRHFRKIAKLTWNFFEKYVSSNTNYLPPDNVTKGIVSKYTSITNIGFYFLSLVCAHRLSLINTKTFLNRFEYTFNTLLKLSMYSGHYYNWYNIETLEVYPPHFLSSVDSGNFYACMVCTRQYLESLNIDGEYLSKIDSILEGMKFSIFINEYDQLSTGYNVTKDILSKDNYDHFASEARLAVYIAIAREGISEYAWGNLIRPFNKRGALLSWGGTVFEYILPQLFLKTYSNSLAESSFKDLLKYNLQFKEKYNIPWGLSESLYVDETTKRYEYKPIGISALSRDPLQVQRTTVTPYATSLLSLIDTKEVIKILIG
jgi:cyclic beta-1,2-glucan synthetase